MRTLGKKFFYSLVLLDSVRSGGTSYNEDGLEVELEKRDAGNTTLAAPIIAVPSQHWYVGPSPSQV
jgi:hypothetical protein